MASLGRHSSAHLTVVPALIAALTSGTPSNYPSAAVQQFGLQLALLHRNWSAHIQSMLVAKTM
jgi:hypothetical protein